uniref:Uncharacterized protein n=1 Tax=Romanomermis culicivorax TaxID=13658 RepID=A0A915JWU6_ROMCU
MDISFTPHFLSLGSTQCQLRICPAATTIFSSTDFVIFPALLVKALKICIDENKLTDLREYIDPLDEVVDEDWVEQYQDDRSSTRKDPFQMSSSN